MTVRCLPSAAIAAALLLAGCAHRATPVAEAVPTPPPSPRPELPVGYGAVVPPPRLADGRYATINADIDAERTVWHVRAALNVAALGCRAPEDAAIVPAYNALLAAEKAPLARANAAVEGSFRADGGDWRAAHDRYMTRLYNFFAMPAAKPAFCAAARSVAPEAAAATPASFSDFAAAALPRLEAPFTAVYAAVDDWKVAVAAWDARATQVAAADAPRLPYADMGAMLAWQPAAGEQIAQR